MVYASSCVISVSAGSFSLGIGKKNAASPDMMIVITLIFILSDYIVQLRNLRYDIADQESCNNDTTNNLVLFGRWNDDR